MLASIAMFLVTHTMIALMLAIGLRTTPEALRATWAERALVWRALLVLELGVPLLAILTVRALPLPYVASEVIAIMAVCPGAPLIYYRLRDRAVVIVILAIVGVLAPITIPIWLAVLDRVLIPGHSVAEGAILRLTLLQQVLPLAIGVVIAATLPREAKVLSRIVWAMFFVGLVLALVIVLAKGFPVLLQARAISIAAVVVMTFGSAAMGHLAGRPRPDDERALGITAALGNPALGLAVMTASVPGFHGVALMCAYAIARAIALVPYTVLTRRAGPKHLERAGGEPTVLHAPGSR
jgi:BASS family bile acid:Na+ symporter